MQIKLASSDLLPLSSMAQQSCEHAICKECLTPFFLICAICLLTAKPPWSPLRSLFPAKHHCQLTGPIRQTFALHFGCKAEIACMVLQPMDPNAADCQTVMSYNHYPSWERKTYKEGTLRRIAHTDFELLTLLFQQPGVRLSLVACSACCFVEPRYCFDITASGVHSTQVHMILCITPPQYM